METKQLAAYRQNSVTTASGVQLTFMLYNGCIKFMNRARKAMDEKDFEAKNTNIQKAQKIIQELIVTLNHDVTLASDLLPLYEFIHFQLQQANITNNPEYLDEAFIFVTDFRDAWKEVCTSQASEYVQGVRI